MDMRKLLFPILFAGIASGGLAFASRAKNIPQTEAAQLTGPGKTFVFAVDQALSSGPRSWTHRVAEAGDYQVGMAWVNVVSGGDVEVTITAGGRQVRSVKARPGLAPHRLEARLEGLAAGDEITVTATPTAATYRLGYQVAFVTPTFPGARVFHVRDFGAVGDGATDDFAAICSAVAAARNAGCAILRFDGSKIYRAIGTENSSTRFRCVDVKFQNNKFEDFHFWFHAGPNGPRPRRIVLEDNWVTDLRIGRIDFQQGLNCHLRGNQLVGVTLGFRDESIDMWVAGNRWMKMKDGQMSVRASTGSAVRLGGGNQRDGEDLGKTVESDETSAVRSLITSEPEMGIEPTTY